MVRGDVDGFFGLALDNLVQLLLIDALCRARARLPDRAGLRPHPAGRRGVAAGRQPLLRLAGAAAGARDRAHRRLRAALRHQHRLALRLRLPGHAAGEARGARRPAPPTRRASPGRPGSSPASAPGSSSSAARFVAERIRRATPRAALLSTLAGIALTFISIGFLFRTFARPVVGLTTLGDRAAGLLRPRALPRRPARRAGGRRARHRCSPGSPASRRSARAPTRRRRLLSCRCRSSATSVAALARRHWLAYLSVILPMGLFNVIGSLQNIESAEAAGDSLSRPGRRSR